MNKYLIALLFSTSAAFAADNALTAQDIKEIKEGQKALLAEQKKTNELLLAIANATLSTSLKTQESNEDKHHPFRNPPYAVWQNYAVTLTTHCVEEFNKRKNEQ